MTDKLEKDQIVKLPIIEYKGEVKIISTTKDAEEIANFLLQKKDFYGFDTETKPVFSKYHPAQKTAIIQIATSDIVYIFCIKQFVIGNNFKKFLNSANALFCGIAIKDDITKLYNEYKLTINNYIDIADIAKQKGLIERGIRTIAAKIYGRQVCKKQKLTNWSIFPLSQKQIIYAATDAWISREIYKSLMNMPDMLVVSG